MSKVVLKSNMITFYILLLIGLGSTFVVATVNATPHNVTNHNERAIFILEAFTDEGFAGSSTIINKNTPSLQGQFHDSISSFRITFVQNQSDGYMLEICDHTSFAGNCIIAGAGEYDVESLGSLNDKISSIRYLSPSSLKLKGYS
jgi:hypothetical protein